MLKLLKNKQIKKVFTHFKLVPTVTEKLSPRLVKNIEDVWFCGQGIREEGGSISAAGQSDQVFVVFSLSKVKPKTRNLRQ